MDFSKARLAFEAGLSVCPGVSPSACLWVFLLVCLAAFLLVCPWVYLYVACVAFQEHA